MSNQTISDMAARILVWGILALVTSWSLLGGLLFGLLAWRTGNNILRYLDAGWGNPFDRYLVVIGRELGIIVSVSVIIIMISGIIIYIIWILLLAIFAGARSLAP